MKARRRETDQHVPIVRSPTIDNPAPINEPNDETGEIVLAVTVKTGHFGGLTAEQGEAVVTAGGGHSTDDIGDDIRLETAGGQIVEKEQRLRSLNEDVVDAVMYEIAPHRGMSASCKGDLELGADAIVGRNEDRVGEARRLEVEEAAEAAERAVRERLISEVSARMREQLDVEAVLNTTADEMVRALDLEEIVIRLTADGSSNN